MSSLVLVGLGIGFLLMGAGLFALTLRKPSDEKAPPANPTRAQQRELAAAVEEKKKMHIAAACAAALGVVLLLLSRF